MEMDRRNKMHLLSVIEWYKQKIEYNAVCKDMNESTQDFIEQIGDLTIPPQVLIEKKLVNYMKGVGLRFNQHKKDTDVIARKWQQQVDQWLRENNLTEKQYLEQLVRKEKTVQPVSPQLNGAWKANQRSSGSDDRQNYHSSGSQDVESPDLQRANQRSSNINHRQNHDQSFVRKSYSPLQLEHPVTRNHNSAEFNANLSIDPKEVIPSNKAHTSPVKPDDRFYIALKAKMFRTVKSKEPIVEKNVSMLLYLCDELYKLPKHKYPEFVLDYQARQIQKAKLDYENSKKSVNGKGEKNSHKSQNVPSTSKEGANNSSKSHPESKHDKRKKHMESPQSAIMANGLKEEQQPSQNSLPTSQMDAVESSKTSSSKHEKKRKHTESFKSTVSSKELKLDRQPDRESKNLPTMAQEGGTESSRIRPVSKSQEEGTESSRIRPVSKPQGGTESSKNRPVSKSQEGETPESSRTCPVSKSQEGGTPESSRTSHSVSKHDKKRKHMENSQSAVKTKESKEKQQPSQDGKPKHVSRTESAVKESKEKHQPSQSRTVKSKETAHSAAKAYEFKDEYKPVQDKMKLDSKQALEARNCDKNHAKKRDSPDQSAMLAITSSKKERTSLYHGGRRSAEVPKLKDLCIRTLIKAIKQNSDPTKFINVNVGFDVLEPILVVISPEKLQKLEEEMKHLKNDTDGVWQLYCEKKFKSRSHLRKKEESWRSFYQRCCMESEEKLRNITASISASASKAKPDRQIKLTTVNGPPTKRHKTATEHAVVAKNNVNNSVTKPLLNSCHPSNSRSDTPVTPKVVSNHVKSSHKTIKKDAPLMHKAKKTLGQLHRIHRN